MKNRKFEDVTLGMVIGAVVYALADVLVRGLVLPWLTSP